MSRFPGFSGGWLQDWPSASSYFGGAAEGTSQASQRSHATHTAPAFGHLLAPVKNTFIHYESSDQPDYRPIRSGPARFYEELRAEEQDCDRGVDSLAAAADYRGVRSSLPAPLTADDSPVKVCLDEAAMAAQASASDEGFETALDNRDMPASVPVKNTFVHFESEFDDQPDYTSTISSPAVFASMSAAAPPAQEQKSLPSKGSVAHAEGTCKPCAHNWKPGGCVKGFDCTFCHLCEGDDFRRRRKEKLKKLKAERGQKKGAGQPENDQEDLPEPMKVACSMKPVGVGLISTASPGLEVVAEASETTSCSHCGNVYMPDAMFCRKCGQTRPTGQAREAERCRNCGNLLMPDSVFCRKCGHSREEAEPASGDLTVNIQRDHVCVRWSLDVRRLHSQNRAGLSRRFTITLSSEEVPFVLFLSPADQASTTSSRTSEKHAMMQVKCTDASKLASAGLTVRVSMAIESQTARVVAEAHNFVTDPVCLLTKEALDLSAFKHPCVLRVEMSLA
eukprot:TRINITY_DN4667_c0_g1_i1.p1 TRINITY_DN4667_c0_g1~~TRINITY_DN4667_c0_g1_i1.p1  ORF type:complete len:520 (+),score=86.93 TRINITY_DN4667_c0_g1_i1:45-1562(+)